ncbi:MAG: hypothetical protein ACJ79M_23450 [Myxococcales bacterium]
MRPLLCAALLALSCGGSSPQGGGSTASPDAGPVPVPRADPPGPSIAGCPVFPVSNDWNQEISTEPVDPRSASFLGHIGTGLKLHADFGADLRTGIPYLVVPPSQPRVPMQFTFASQSDPGPYPFPDDVPIQGGRDAPGDRHAVVIDSGACLLYETYDTHWLGPGLGYRAGSGAIFDLRTGAARPDGWTSATASGLPLFPGLARYEEVLAGEIRHALTFTAGTAARSFVHPGTHPGTSDDPDAPPMAARLRLKASYDLTATTGMSRVVLVALKRYGMFLVDEAEGSFVAISGATDSRWDDRDLDQLKAVPLTAFEVVQLRDVRAR